MKLVYLLVSDGSEWDDIVVYLTEEEAIESSIIYPNSRVEIFTKHRCFNQYVPTYNYYQNGVLYPYSGSFDVE
jgi:hypothetical protein